MALLRTQPVETYGHKRTICVVLCPHVLVAPMVLARALAGAGLTLVTLFSGSSAVPFIYFQV